MDIEWLKPAAVFGSIVYALIGLFESAASDESVRVVHLTGEGEHFCSGFDLGERTNGPDKPRVGSIHRRMNGHVNRLVPAMLTAQTPIVATVRGWAIGLGLDLALASDFTIVADDARLWAPFTTFGFTPDSGASWLLPRLVGVARARELLMQHREQLDLISYELIAQETIDAEEFDRLFNGGETKTSSVTTLA